MKFRILETDEPINIKETLFSGQVFNFIETDKGEYTGVVYDLIISFKQENDLVSYRLIKCENNFLKQLTDLLIDSPEYGFDSIDASHCHNLAQSLNESLTGADEEMGCEFLKELMNLLIKIAETAVRCFLTLNIEYKSFIPENLYLKHKGLRLIRNAVVPTIFSFICSQNNNIKRITSMTRCLYSKGTFACTYKGIDFFFFPDLKKLIDLEEDLRSNKFGYRSRYVVKTAAQLLEDVYREWLLKDSSLLFNLLGFQENKENVSCSISKEKIRNQLTELTGVGPKVADCILLMGFGFYEVVPIDTHIYKYAVDTFKLNKKSLSKKDYLEVQEAFVNKFGEYAGIVQLYIFKSYI